MEAYLQTLIAYFSVHPYVALAAVFSAAALEAIALIGTVIPGSFIVFIGGVLIGLNVLDPWRTASAAVTGAVLGDGLSYWLGHCYRDRLRTLWPMKKYPALLNRGQAYFAQNGGKSVFFGRFLGPVRAIVPVIAGMSGMRPVLFYGMNGASALAWSAAHLLPGAMFGASLQVAGAVSSRLVVLLLVFAALTWLLFRCLPLLFRYGWPYCKALRDRIVTAAQRRQGPGARFALSLLDPGRPESGPLLVAAVLLLAAAWLFLGVVEDVISQDPLVQLDSSIYQLLKSVRTEWVDRLMIAITELGGAAGTLALIGTTSLYFAFRRCWRTLGYWLAAAGFAETLVWVLKLTLGRARPHNIYTDTEQFSFPSGHATLSIVVYGFLAFLLANGKSVPRKTAVTLVAAATIALISFSRLYLGVHWLSDVLGGLSVGLAWVALLSIAYMHHVKGERIDLLPISLVIIATLVTVGIFQVNLRGADYGRIYADSSVATVALLPDWKEQGWRRLPFARSEVDGDFEEPFTVQWAATATELSETLAAANWLPPQHWGLQALLLWLVPQTPIAQLPVLPKFDHGQAQKINFVRVLNPKERAVIRLWLSPYQVPGNAELPPRPLWVGTMTIEHLERLPGLVTFARTQADFVRPIEELQKDLQHAHVSTERRVRQQMNLLLIR